MGSKIRFYCDIMGVHPEVTGSCNLIVVKLPNGETVKFVVDCGLFQEKGYEELNKNFPFKSENIDFCLVTHNHVDHIGRLPLMVKEGFRGNIYTSIPTSRFMPLALEDSFKVLRDTAKRKSQKMLYTEADVLKTELLLSPCEFYEPIRVNDYVTVTFLKNGHLIGAALILVQIRYPENEDINLLFTGDYNNKNFFFDVPEIPVWIRKLPLTLIIESTYGYMESKSMTKLFEKNVLDVINEGGSVIAPVFSLGRSQEILYEIKCMQENGELDKNVPIYFDGKLAQRYTGMYLKEKLLGIKPEMQDFLPAGESLTLVNRLNRPQVLYDTGRKIVLTTSGMGTYGPAQRYIPEYLPRKNSLIHFTGYTAEGTLGEKLKSAKYGEDVEVGGLIVNKRARVEYTTEFSAHAKADELLKLLNQFKSLKLVLVNHGQEDVKESFAKRIYDEISPKNVGILGRDYFYRVDSYGLARPPLYTKFR